MPKLYVDLINFDPNFIRNVTRDFELDHYDTIIEAVKKNPALRLSLAFSFIQKHYKKLGLPKPINSSDSDSDN